ncbi:MAG: hypothetical protein A2033_12935 [Bacteroidetes bacterium GWA2_31_9]|nr:MAG: hypothetical protein A2033_12935 [Bacteroidetes bacterium GWA2_31_9]
MTTNTLHTIFEKYKTGIIISCLLLFIGGILCYIPVISSEFKTFDKVIYTDGVTKTLTFIEKSKSDYFFDFLGLFLRTAAISIFIAFFISTQISKYLLQKDKEENKILLEQINEDIFASLFKLFMPNKLFNKIKADLLEDSLIWDYININLKIYKLNGEFICDESIQITIKNYGAKNKAHNINLDGGNLIGEKELIGMNQSNPVNNEVTNFKDKKENSFELKPNESTDIHLNAKYKHKNNFLFYNFKASRPLLAGNIFIDFASDIKLHFIDNTSNSFVEIPNSTTKKNYKINNVLFQNQGFSILVQDAI